MQEYFIAIAAVWRDYNNKKINMKQRDEAIAFYRKELEKNSDGKD
jgi:hypothetical protein